MKWRILKAVDAGDLAPQGGLWQQVGEDDYRTPLDMLTQRYGEGEYLLVQDEGWPSK